MLKGADHITKIAGVGDKKAQTYEKLSIRTVRDLLLHLPRRFLDLTKITPLENCTPNQSYLIKVTITKKSPPQRIRNGLTVFKVLGVDGLEDISITFYNTKFTVDALKIGESYYLYGEMGGSFIRHEMNAPIIMEPWQINRLMPVYSVTAGISSKVVAKDIKNALSAISEPIEDCLDKNLCQKLAMPTLQQAINMVHNPKTIEEYEQGVRRISFDELLVFCCVMLKLKSQNVTQRGVPMVNCDSAPLIKTLPFAPTRDQAKAILDIANDLMSEKVMNRLVQGDVGCGKTLVAAAAAFMVGKNNGQTAMMAPTELLAQQHYQNLSAMLCPVGMKIALITGSLKKSQRNKLEQEIANGEYDLVVGTHAVISQGVQFKCLRLMITDEQHRFGVAQRSALLFKGQQVHTLVMSATPIPRTLSLIVHGDLDISLIKELPPGRTAIATYKIDYDKHERALGFIKKHIKEGRQAYIVCPLAEIQEEKEEVEEKLQLFSAEEMAKTLQENQFADCTVGLLHGKLKPAQKQEIMEKFSTGEISLLVATTVVEVGVDVPNAVIMLIENAERFGLSQLHQLRGRVGRGSYQSHCILVSDAKGEIARQRLEAIAKSNDGFFIAEEDLRLRGPGDILGTRQHGFDGFKNIDLLKDSQLLATAQNAAKEILAADYNLLQPENKYILESYNQLITKIGENPN